MNKKQEHLLEKMDIVEENADELKKKFLSLPKKVGMAGDEADEIIRGLMHEFLKETE